MIFSRSFKITPNFISRYKSCYLIEINNKWFLYEFNKYRNTHKIELLTVLSSTSKEPFIYAFDNGSILIMRHDQKSSYGSVIQMPIEEKEPRPESILEIQKKYNDLMNFEPKIN